MRHPNERGIAMITTLLVMMLVSALLVGFTAVIMSDQRYRFVDRDRTQAFYAASAGIEKLTTDLGNLFFTTVAPTSAQVQALATTPPTIEGVQFVRYDGSSGYTITASAPTSTTITSGPYQGLIALMTKYTLDATAHTSAGGEVHLQRVTETVAIPVFQFGMFSDVDLSFFAGPAFDFGGRVHTNGNLFLAEGSSNSLIMRDKVTAVKEVVRKRLQNGVAITTSGHTGPVKIATASGACTPTTNPACRALSYSNNGGNGEGSVTDGLSPATPNEPAWTTVSLSSYNGYLRNGTTGAKTLNLPLITLGGANTDLVRRPAPNEDTTNPILFGERYFSKASMRILLSDTPGDISGLPTVTGTAPVLLDGDWVVAPPNNGTPYGPVDATHPPIARSPGLTTATLNGAVAAGATTITLVATPNGFRPAGGGLNNLTLNVAPGPVPTPITCTGRTVGPPIQFTGCTGVVAAAIGDTVTAIVDSVPLTATLTAAAGAGATTLTVNTVARFGNELYWLSNTPITCTGNTPTQLLGCSGVPAAANGQIIATSALSNQGTGVVGGYLKIEVQTGAGVWQDVTMEILNWGFAGPNLLRMPGDAAATICADPTPNAIIRLQRLRDSAATCNYAASQKSIDYWPNTLFDAREALQRDISPGAANIVLGGVMHYVTLDVRNLSRWFQGLAPYGGGTGTLAMTNNGYTVYFSDRRNNRDGSNQETGEYGFEDFVNPLDANGVPNGTLDAGEDVNANGVLDTYGQFPSYNGLANTVPPGAQAPLDGTARPTTAVGRGVAQVNRAIFFRRALKLTNGAIVGGVRQIVAPGLTIATENPVYIQGDWNASTGGFTSATDVAQHVATSVIADAVTLLSSAWNDNLSFSQPYAPGNRPRATSFVRVAIISGKGPAFPQPSQPAPGGGGNAWDFGTDGGAHNFLRFLEGGGGTLNYRGSIATFYYNRQGIGTYKCCSTVYSPPTRAFAFDLDFLDPNRLPPLTPVFRDLNTIGFSQEARPDR